MRENNDMHCPKQPYTIVFELSDASGSDVEAVYQAVHAEGGYHYVHGERSWGRLPQRTVVMPLAAGWNAACARVAFELLLAKLGLMANSIAVIAGEPAVELAELSSPPPLFATAAQQGQSLSYRATGTNN
jgi:hypothetical protein